MDSSQRNTIFMPGLTARGPVYSGSGGLLGALPTVSPMVKFGLIGVLLYLGTKRKIPMIAAGAGALAVWQFLPSEASAAPVALAPGSTPNVTPPPFDQSTLQMPEMEGI